MAEDPERRIEELEQRLFDERRERDVAQRRAAEMFDRVEIWRKRAEDRAARIKKLEAERDKLRGAVGWLRRGRRAVTKPTQVETPAPTPEPGDGVAEGGSPLLPGVRCVTAIASPDLTTATAAFDAAALDPSVSLMEADVVLVDAEGFMNLPGETADGLVQWASVSGRPPLVVTSDTAPDIARYAQNVIDADDLTGRFFDPSQWSPPTRGDRDTEPLGFVSVDVEGFGQVVVEPFDVASTRHLELAAQGVPFYEGDAGTLAPDAARRLGVQYRRFAYERRTTELERLFDQLTLETPTIRPTVAGILVSNRPDDVVKAIEGLRRQRAPNFEVVVGCHGFSSSVVASAVDRLAEHVPVNVLEFGSEMSLGACLNRAISTTGADVIAKMDDDDHYGPAYLIDALHALAYGGVPVVGKGTSFTYLESEDRTVIRRPGNEERLSRGSPTGATLVWARSLWEANPFAHRSLGEDLAFLRGARRLGYQVYINSVYEFVYHRRRSGNTWQAADALFLEGAEPAWDGENPTLADVPDLGISRE
ncbi:MAG: hypothetical protein U9N79_00470 [Actinomycetota bacterium]|nr:hypothetical protein [Actinomycetota bacterium]